MYCDFCRLLQDAEVQDQMSSEEVAARKEDEEEGEIQKLKVAKVEEDEDVVEVEEDGVVKAVVVVVAEAISRPGSES